MSAIRTRPAPPERRVPRLLFLLGPAFVAAVAYVDPGNVAANLTAGARFGYLLVWVLVVANLMAVLVQYLSAKLGIVTGRSLPQALGDRLPRPARLGYWLQAELVAAATDLAEVIGGAIALHLLFGVPLVLGGIITGVVSLVILAVQQRGGQRMFEAVITGMLAVLTVGFCAGLFFAPPDAGGVLAGLVPRLAGADSLLLAASMLGATVMPHAIYLHSSLARDRHRPAAGRSSDDGPGTTPDAGGLPGPTPRADAVPPASGTTADGTTADGERERDLVAPDAGGLPDDRRAVITRLLRATRVDVVLALVLAGGVNIGMLLLAAANLPGRAGTDSIEGAYVAIGDALGGGIAVLFAVGLLFSGVASTSVGAYAGAEIMAGLLKVRVSLLVRRLVTLIPAIVLLTTGLSPTWLLVVSQVVLSFGIPFAMIPLVRLTRDRALLGEFRNGVATQLASWLVAAVIVALNVALLYLTLNPNADVRA